MEFMCCSWDGTVAYFEFDVSEIGNPMTLQEKVRHLNYYVFSVMAAACC